MSATKTAQGTLYLVPTPLDFGCTDQMALASVLPEQTLRIAAGLNHWICENAKSTRAFLKRVDGLIPLSVPLQAQQIQELPRTLHKHGDHDGAGKSFDAKPLLAQALAAHGSHDIGLCSEAGMPAIADPGSSVVRAAHALEIAVVPLVGPVSLLLALAASGLNGQNFAFVGYLPQQAQERSQRIRQLESLALKTDQTQLFIETPYRNTALWNALLQNLAPATRLLFASGLTLAQTRIDCKTVAAWRQESGAVLPDVPAVFAIGP